MLKRVEEYRVDLLQRNKKWSKRKDQSITPDQYNLPKPRFHDRDDIDRIPMYAHAMMQDETNQAEMGNCWAQIRILCSSLFEFKPEVYGNYFLYPADEEDPDTLIQKLKEDINFGKQSFESKHDTLGIHWIMLLSLTAHVLVLLDKLDLWKWTPPQFYLVMIWSCIFGNPIGAGKKDKLNFLDTVILDRFKILLRDDEHTYIYSFPSSNRSCLEHCVHLPEVLKKSVWKNPANGHNSHGVTPELERYWKTSALNEGLREELKMEKEKAQYIFTTSWTLAKKFQRSPESVNEGKSGKPQPIGEKPGKGKGKPEVGLDDKKGKSNEKCAEHGKPIVESGKPAEKGDGKRTEQEDPGKIGMHIVDKNGFKGEEGKGSKKDAYGKKSSDSGKHGKKDGCGKKKGKPESEKKGKSGKVLPQTLDTVFGDLFERFPDHYGWRNEIFVCPDQPKANRLDFVVEIDKEAFKKDKVIVKNFWHVEDTKKNGAVKALRNYNGTMETKIIDTNGNFERLIKLEDNTTKTIRLLHNLHYCTGEIYANPGTGEWFIKYDDDFNFSKRIKHLWKPDLDKRFGSKEFKDHLMREIKNQLSTLDNTNNNGVGFKRIHESDLWWLINLYMSFMPYTNGWDAKTKVPHMMQELQDFHQNTFGHDFIIRDSNSTLIRTKMSQEQRLEQKTKNLDIHFIIHNIKPTGKFSLDELRQKSAEELRHLARGIRRSADEEKQQEKESQQITQMDEDKKKRRRSKYRRR